MRIGDQVPLYPMLEEPRIALPRVTYLPDYGRGGQEPIDIRTEREPLLRLEEKPHAHRHASRDLLEGELHPPYRGLYSLPVESLIHDPAKGFQKIFLYPLGFLCRGS